MPTERPYQVRPRFTEREGRLLLAAVLHWRKTDDDLELRDLYTKLAKHWGDGGADPDAR